jgi:hypothetical protein
MQDNYIKNTWNSSEIKVNIEFGDNLNSSINNHTPFTTHVHIHCLEINLIPSYDQTLCINVVSPLFYGYL